MGALVLALAIPLLTADRVDGFYTTDAETMAQPSSAIISGDIDLVVDAPGTIPDWFNRVFDLRITAMPNTDAALFIGVAETAYVTQYLGGVSYHEVTDMRFGDNNITYDTHEGTRLPGAPGLESFWIESAAGAGNLAFDWPIESGNYSVVLMNADGAPGVDADLVFGARIAGAIAGAWIASGLGALVMLLGLWMAVGGNRPVSPAMDPVSEPRQTVSN